jgi:hypothetical protein
LLAAENTPWTLGYPFDPSFLHMGDLASASSDLASTFDVPLYLSSGLLLAMRPPTFWHSAFADRTTYEPWDAIKNAFNKDGIMTAQLKM